MDDLSLSLPFEPYRSATDIPNYGDLTSGEIGANLALGKFYSDFEDRIGLVENYSDLEYQQVAISVGGTYNFTERLYASANLTYSDFDSDEDYVYGDESGSSYYGYLGVGYRF